MQTLVNAVGAGQADADSAAAAIKVGWWGGQRGRAQGHRPEHLRAALLGRQHSAPAVVPCCAPHVQARCGAHAAPGAPTQAARESSDSRCSQNVADVINGAVNGECWQQQVFGLDVGARCRCGRGRGCRAPAPPGCRPALALPAAEINKSASTPVDDIKGFAKRLKDALDNVVS